MGAKVSSSSGSTYSATITYLDKVVNFGTGTTVAGTLYYLNSSGAWTIADADSVASGSNQMLGIAQGTSPSSNGILIKGDITLSSTLTGWDEGVAVYASTTAGEFTTTPPSGTGDFVRVLGNCTATTNEIIFDPSRDFVELA